MSEQLDQLSRDFKKWPGVTMAWPELQTSLVRLALTVNKYRDGLPDEIVYALQDVEDSVP